MKQQIEQTQLQNIHILDINIHFQMFYHLNTNGFSFKHLRFIKNYKEELNSMEKNINTQITEREKSQLVHKSCFKNLINEQKSIEYSSVRNSLDVSRQGSENKNAKEVIYLSISSKCKKSENCNKRAQNIDFLKLPLIFGKEKRLKQASKYFKRHDVIKDYCDFSSNKQNKNSAEKGQKCPKKTKYMKLSPKQINSVRRLINSSGIYKNYVVSLENDKIYHKEKKLKRKTMGNQRQQSQAQIQIRELSLIKKKNEFQVQKLKRKNNYQRMQSNMIIAQALNQLMDKRQKLLIGQNNVDMSIFENY